MARQFKKFFPIFLALFLGVAIIVVAVKGESIFSTTVSFTPAKEDSSWKSALSIIPGDKSFARVEKGTVKAEDSAFVDTTTTDLISRKLLLDYTAFQKKTGVTTLSDEDASALATNLVQEIKFPESTQYKLTDLNISKDNSATAGELYKKTLTALITEMINANNKDISNKEDTLSIVGRASDTQDSSILGKLGPIITRHQTLIKNLLALKTPSSIEVPHLHLLQSYEDLRTAMVGLQKLLVDPVIGLTAITEYQNGVAELIAAVEEYNNFRPASQ